MQIDHQRRRSDRANHQEKQIRLEVRVRQAELNRVDPGGQQHEQAVRNDDLDQTQSRTQRVSEEIEQHRRLIGVPGGDVNEKQTPDNESCNRYQIRQPAQQGSPEAFEERLAVFPVFTKQHPQNDGTHQFKRHKIFSDRDLDQRERQRQQRIRPEAARLAEGHDHRPQ